MINKRGEITTTQIALFVLAILGFAIVLGVFFLFDFGGGISKDTCKLSVVSRGTAASIASGAQSIVPLKCTTDKICVTDKLIGGSCDQFIGEKEVTIVRISGTPQQKATKIEEISANAMYDCWDMMGQGKIDLFRNFYTANDLNPSKATCVICARIAIDKNVNADVLDLVNVNEYMRAHNVPGKDLTYLQAFTDKGISSYAQVSGNFGADAGAFGGDLIKLEEAKEEFKISGQQGQLVVNRELAFVFSQIKANKEKSTGDILTSIGKTTATTAGATFIMASRVVDYGTAAVSAFYVGLGTIPVATGKEILGAYNVQESQVAAAGYCGGFSSADENDQWGGCSVVQAVNYDFKAINSICSSIQGNP